MSWLQEEGLISCPTGSRQGPGPECTTWIRHCSTCLLISSSLPANGALHSGHTWPPSSGFLLFIFPIRADTHTHKKRHDDMSKSSVLWLLKIPIFLVKLSTNLLCVPKNKTRTINAHSHQNTLLNPKGKFMQCPSFFLVVLPVTHPPNPHTHLIRNLTEQNSRHCTPSLCRFFLTANGTQEH